MYTTDIQVSGTVSATDDERLPPGGFSLRHGFPAWFGRASRRSADRASNINTQTPMKASDVIDSPTLTATGRSFSPLSSQATEDSPSSNETRGKQPSTYDVLRYIRSTFDDEQVMDELPLEAAGNPGAWHAWRTHRAKSSFSSPLENKELARAAGNRPANPSEAVLSTPIGSASMTARRPGEWNWDGVWEMRVKRGIDASIADAALFGASAGDDLIRFLNLDTEQVETIQENIRRSLETSEPQRRGIV